MRLKAALGTAAIAITLLGCGGGGGGGLPQPPGPLPPPPPPPPPAPTADSFRTAEYKRTGALDAVHAAEAYALGYTGAGVIVGVVDFNFQFSATDEINYHSASIGANAQSVALHQAQTGTTVDNQPHGHAVAGVIGAKKNDAIVHGIAFDAQVLAVDFFSNVNETVISQGGVQYHVSDPWTYITARGSKIINVSFGYDSGDIIPNPPVVTEAYTAASPSVAVINGALLVASAGNNGGSNPSLSNLDSSASWPRRTPSPTGQARSSLRARSTGTIRSRRSPAAREAPRTTTWSRREKTLACCIWARWASARARRFRRR